MAVLSLHASSGQVGLLGAAQWLPFLLVALPVGVVIDRHRRRPFLVAAEWIRVIGTTTTIHSGMRGTCFDGRSPAMVIAATLIAKLRRS